MNKKLFTTVFFLITVLAYGQTGNINNTLGTGGSFIVKDGSTTFLSLNQSSGFLSLNKCLELPATLNSTTGVIYKNGASFLQTYGFQNTFLGTNSGNFTATGSSNTAFGFAALQSLTSGGVNSAFGAFSLYSNSSGFNNSAFGFGSLESNTTGSNNCAFGLYSLVNNTTGSKNSAFGEASLFHNVTGKNNSAFGEYSLQSNSTGNNNSAFGTSALQSNTTGIQNTAVGFKALFTNISGFQNTAVGDSALYNNTGNYNTALGYNAGTQVTTGANLTLIGIDANPSAGTAIDEITLGNIFVGTLRCHATSITFFSDRRDKKNISDLSLGLNFITKLKPRQFNWDVRQWYENGISDGSKMETKLTAGFIAQELDSIQTTENAEWLNLVMKNNPDRLEATPGNLLPVIVKAIQELNEKVEQLKFENEKLKEEKDVEIAKLKKDNLMLLSEIENLKTLEAQLSEIENLKAELMKQIKISRAE